MICLGPPKKYSFSGHKGLLKMTSKQAVFLRFKNVIFDKTRFATGLMEKSKYFVYFTKIIMIVDASL